MERAVQRASPRAPWGGAPCTACQMLLAALRAPNPLNPLPRPNPIPACTHKANLHVLGRHLAVVCVRCHLANLPRASQAMSHSTLSRAALPVQQRRQEAVHHNVGVATAGAGEGWVWVGVGGWGQGGRERNRPYLGGGKGKLLAQCWRVQFATAAPGSGQSLIAEHSPIPPPPPLPHRMGEV
jgi:hypothetical protein